MPFIVQNTGAHAAKAGVGAEYKGRAFVVTVGVSHFQNSIWNLPYAASDADALCAALTRALRAGVQFDSVAGVALTSGGPRAGKGTDGAVRAATKENIHHVLMILAGKGESLTRDQWSRIDPHHVLSQSTPDDLVVLSFATHGFNDGGEFYLLASDTGPNRGEGKRLTAELKKRAISTADLAYWLRAVDAGDMVLIVDACHSAAATGQDFKPGPMGSRGLGQLAYDKGMRLLASTQASTQAFEIGGRIRRGLLTYALVDLGLNAHTPRRGGRAGSGKTTLDAWLNHAVAEVPLLHERVKARKGFTTPLGVPVRIIARDGVEDAAAKRNPGLQRPALFDFANRLRRSRSFVLVP